MTEIPEDIKSAVAELMISVSSSIDWERYYHPDVTIEDAVAALLLAERSRSQAEIERLREANENLKLDLDSAQEVGARFLAASDLSKIKLDALALAVIAAGEDIDDEDC